jgi:hypothetical protein
MDAAKRKRLAKAGFTVGDTKDFLGLTEAESLYVELKVSLAAALRAARTSRRMTQIDAARVLGSSQSRVAKMEAADASVSIDLLVRSLFVLGTSAAELAKAIRRPPLKPAKALLSAKRRVAAEG